MQEQLCHISSSIWKYFLNINQKQIYIYVWPFHIDIFSLSLFWGQEVFLEIGLWAHKLWLHKCASDTERNCRNCCLCCWGSHLNELLIEGTNRGKWLLIRIYHNQLKRSVFRSVVYAFKEFLKKLKYKFSSKSETIGTKAAAFWRIIFWVFGIFLFSQLDWV